MKPEYKINEILNIQMYAYTEILQYKDATKETPNDMWSLSNLFCFKIKLPIQNKFLF